MSIYSVNETGTKAYRTRFNLSFRKLLDCDFAKIIPVLAKFCIPNDVWKIGADMLIRYQPTMAPPLTRAWARVRYFFVPLRLVEENCEQIITGSKEGKLIETELPTFEKAFDKVSTPSGYTVSKHSFWDYMGIPSLDYKNIKNDKSIPTAYWLKGYLRCFFDYYRDENLYPNNDFNTIVKAALQRGGLYELESPSLHKDYFTSSLPWQLKGTTPMIEISGGSADFTNSILPNANEIPGYAIGVTEAGNDPKLGKYNERVDTSPTIINSSQLLQALNNNVISGVGSISMDDLRTMAAQTRIFERLARCGSRYTEYLRANFGISPADGTLQRAQYLGGFKQPIVTTEVVQTGGNDSLEVGTLRGHGISHGGNTIKPFVCKEFGMLFGLLDIMPELQYTQGIDRELTYDSRFDFFNPSFQHLSEQEVRNGELFISNTDGKNDAVFGYQAIYNELRTSRDLVVGDMRDTLSYWTQAIKFNSRPNLNYAFIKAESYISNFHEPFTVQNGALPMIVDFGNILDVYRPMVKYGTPGLVDHL